MKKNIILAGGCFWCIQADLASFPGVLSALSGYTGGSAETAHYEDVASRKTKHREAVSIDYDSEKATFKDLVHFFLDHIDPSDGGGQFYDRGYQYEPCLYWTTEEEKNTCEESLQELRESGLYEKVSVHIEKASSFFVAEDYHQDYALQNKEHYDAYKKASGRETFVQKTCALREDKKIIWKK